MRYHFTSQAQLALNNAKKTARACQNSYIGTEHLLLGILEVPHSRLAEILKKDHVTYQSLYEEIVTLFGFSKETEGPAEYTCTMEEILQQCLIQSYENEQKLVDLDGLSLCLLRAENNVANELLRRNGVDIEAVMEELKTDRLAVLDQFKELRNLNEAQRKNPTRIVQREQEMKTMMDTLCRKMKANPLLIGEAGVGKSALVEELARRILQHEVPRALENCVIYELNLNHLVAGTKYRGEFEEKIQKLLDTVKRFPQVILFIDEIHMMIHAGKAEGSIDVAGVLKPLLARGDLRCIGATTIDEYNSGIEKDRALKRRFQVIRIEEPSLEDVRKMLLCKKEEYENHHQVSFPEALIEECLHLSAQYLPQLTFPDKAIDVMDLSCVQARRQGIKQVDEECLKKAIETLSQIPFSFAKKAEEKNSLLAKVLPETEVKLLLDRLKRMDQGHLSEGPRDVWLLNGPQEESKRQLAQTLAKLFLNQEKALTVLDGLMMSGSTLVYLAQQLKKNPFQILYVENYDQMSGEMEHCWDQIIHQGHLQFQEQTLDFSFSLILLDVRKAQRSVGFVRRQEKDPGTLFSLTMKEKAKRI